MIGRRLLLAGIALLSGCTSGGRDGADSLPLALHSAGPSTLLRLPGAGGTARAYRPGDLAPLDWKAEKVPPIRRVVGTDIDLGIVYALDSSGSLLALDLKAQRTRVIRKGVRLAAVTADGSVLMADTAGAMHLMGRRRTQLLEGRLPPEATRLVGSLQGHALVLPSARQPDLTVFAAGAPARTIPLPAGSAAATAAGDLVAVAADSEVVLLDPARPERARHLELSGHARDVAFSPSGHRLYVAQDRPALREYDRFGDRWRGAIDLPGPARAVRSVLYGTHLLVRPAEGDSVWVLDPALRAQVAAVAASWGPDLPLVAPRAALVVRRAGDVVSLDLEGAEPRERGRVADGARDLWLVVGWAPPRSATDTLAGALGADSIAYGSGDSTPGARLFLQVSSSRNAEWARELATKISDAGVEATVLRPGPGEDVYRVVVGPYATRDEADSAGRGLGMPSFVITLPAASR